MSSATDFPLLLAGGEKIAPPLISLGLIPQ
jgi:hypothetical protein